MELSESATKGGGMLAERVMKMGVEEVLHSTNDTSSVVGVAVMIGVGLLLLAALISYLGGWLRWPKNRLQEGVFLNKERKQITLLDKSEISHDTRRLVFALERKDQPLGLPTGQHLIVFGPNRRGKDFGKWNGKEDSEKSEEIVRKYTPVSSQCTSGKVELVVKVYANNSLPQFPDGGKMSQYLEELDIGAKIDVNGPFGRIIYRGWGSFEISQRKVTKSRVGFIAGGSGITPIFQVIRSVLENHSDPTKLYVIYANKTEDDILLRDELEEFENQYPDRLKLWYTLETPPEKWRYSTGFVTAPIIRSVFPPPSDDFVVFCCGPRPMVEFGCKMPLQELGYSLQDVACF